MKISLSDLGKRFNREWIFRHIDLEFSPPVHYAITGHNGSGKSTLLQLLAGSIHHNEGAIVHQLDHQMIPPEKVNQLVSFCAPYLEVPDAFTLNELLAFHFTFKSIVPKQTFNTIIEEAGLSNAANKQIRYFSSGMKQRVRLALAFFSDTPLLLLDEPCSNLDQEGIERYHKMIRQTAPERLVIISSNDPQEYRHCQEIISLEKWKP